MKHIISAALVALVITLALVSQVPINPGTGSSSSSGGGSSVSDQCALSIAGSVLTIGATSTPTAPCKVGVGENLLTVTAPATVTLSGSTATSTLRVWMDQTGLNAGSLSSTPTVTCNAQCSVAVAPVTTFPDEAYPIAQVTYTSNVFDTLTAAMDLRVFQYHQKVVGGTTGTVSVTTNPATGAREVDLASTVRHAWTHVGMIAGQSAFGTQTISGVTFASNTQLTAAIFNSAAWGYFNTLSFQDGVANTSYIGGRLPLSSQWDGGTVTVTLQALIPTGSAIVDATVARFEISTVCPVAATGTVWPGTFGSATPILMTFTPISTVSIFNYTATASVPLSGCLPGTTPFWQLRRTPPNAGDTAAIDVGLYAIIFNGTDYVQ